MQIKEVDVEKVELFSIGQQYSHNALVIHFVNLPNLKNKYIYYKIDDIEEEIPLVSDLFIVSRPLTLHSGEVKAQIIVRDEANETIGLTKNFTMIITPSNYSGIGEDESYPDDPNIKNYFVKIDEKVNSFEELANLVQTKLDNGEFVGAQGPKGDKGDKGEPGDVTEEYRDLANQVAQNATSAQTSATNAQTSATNAQKAFDDTKEFANQTKTELNQIKTDTSALKEEANASAVNAKASETKAKEYADNLQASTDDISKLKEDLGNQKKAINELADKKITKFYASNQGETHITDSDNGKIQDMMVYGKSSQDGTPSIESPVEIKSVVNPTVKITNEDGLKVQSVMFDNITLNAIPVSSDGNVTINGQQYIADYVDVGKNKRVGYTLSRQISPDEVGDTILGINACYILDNKIVKPSKDSEVGHIMCSHLMQGSWNNVVDKGNQGIALNSKANYIGVNITGLKTVADYKEFFKNNNVTIMYQINPIYSDLPEKNSELSTYYPVTNISVNSEQLDGYAVFNYPISLANGWNYVKQQLNDNRDYIYDMDLQSAEAYVNSEYAVTLTELEV